MQPPFPTKKFFVILLFLIVVSGGIFKLFKYLNNRSVQVLEEQKMALVQKTVLPLQKIPTVTVPSSVKETKVATSTLNAIAAVVYLNEQTKQNGTTMDQITASMAQEIITAQAKLDGNAYSQSDITVGTDNSPEAMKKYGNDLAGIFSLYGQDKHEPYFDIIKKALETHDQKEFKKLDPYIDFQKNVIKDALALKVPPAMAAAHLHIINACAEEAMLLQGFQNSFSDLPSAVASNTRIVKSSARFVDAFNEANTVFKQNGVVYLPGEGGALFASFQK